MEIKINKEIRAYQESIFFGLSVRQFIYAVLAIIVAISVYLSLQDQLGKETASWLCILAAAPFAAAGFFRYNGMTIGKFLLAFLKSELLLAGNRVYKSENLYHTLLMQPLKRKGRFHL